MYQNPKTHEPWPFVPSSAFPGERTLACGACLSTHVTLTSRPRGLGTGPGGRHRLGDPADAIARCEACGAVAENV